MSAVTTSVPERGAIQVHGHIASGFEPVGEAFAATDIGDGGAAFTAYVDGERVVDVWRGYARPGVAWSADTVTTLFSSTKGIAAVAVAVLVDRGLVDPDEKVAKYWPEFAQAGKEDALVRHILDHTVGVVGLPDAQEVLTWDGPGWDRYEEISRRLAAAAPAWTPGEHQAYHAITYGWLVAELVRRVDGRSLGQFFAEEIAQPLALDLWIGTPADVQSERATDLFRASLDGIPEGALSLMNAIKEAGRDPKTLWGQTAIPVPGGSIADSAIEFFGSPAGRSPEIAGAGGVGSARSLAKLYAALSLGGELDGVRIVSPETIDRFSAVSAAGPSFVQPPLPDGFPPIPTEMKYGLGFQINNIVGPGASPWTFGPNHAAFGHSGMGGQVGFADPVRRVGAGYVRNHESLGFHASDTIVASLYKVLDA